MDDAKICTVIVTLAAFDAEDFYRRHVEGWNKAGTAMVYWTKQECILYWIRKAIAAFKMGAE
jgi:hypothetical protein